MADEPATKADAEPVNTTVAAVPFVDLLHFESATGTRHLVNAYDAYIRRMHADAYAVEVRSMCGGASIDVPVDGDLTDADGLYHLADEVTPRDINENGKLMNHPYRVLDGVCKSCIASWDKVFNEGGDYQTVVFDMGDGSWE